MPKRIREKEVFAYLGLPRPAQGAEGEELLDGEGAHLHGHPYHWWRRYRIGADFALECHLETHRRDVPLDQGTLTSAVIQSIKVDRDGKAHYVDLRPYFDRNGVIEGYHRSHMDRSDWNAP